MKLLIKSMPTFVLCIAAYCPTLGAAETDVDDRWDQVLRGIEISEESPQTDTPTPPSKSRPKHIRSNYTGLEAPRPPTKKTTGQQLDYANDTRAASREAVDAEMQMMTESIDDLMPRSPEPALIELPEKPSGLHMSDLPAGSFHDNIERMRLLFKLDVNNADHTRYMMSYLARLGQQGWSWEQKKRIQDATLNGPAYTELEISLTKPVQ